MSAPRRALICTLLTCSCLMLGACDKEALEAKDAEIAKLGEQAKASASELEAKQASLAELEAKLAAAEAAQAEKNAETDAKIAKLEGDKGKLEGELEQQQAALDKIKTLSETLAKTLVKEMETGEIRVSERGGYLVVNVSDKVLFEIGKAELSKRGQKVITKLAESLKTLPEESVFQVGGHTDNQPIKSQEVLDNFPTNWELSAARATTVVRFLEETCEVPGERLVAAGFSQFRPVAKNSKPKGRAKNRRIEIALLPPRD